MLDKQKCAMSSASPPLFRSIDLHCTLTNPCLPQPFIDASLYASASELRAVIRLYGPYFAVELGQKLESSLHECLLSLCGSLMVLPSPSFLHLLPPLPVVLPLCALPFNSAPRVPPACSHLTEFPPLLRLQSQEDVLRHLSAVDQVRELVPAMYRGLRCRGGEGTGREEQRSLQSVDVVPL